MNNAQYIVALRSGMDARVTNSAVVTVAGVRPAGFLPFHEDRRYYRLDIYLIHKMSPCPLTLRKEKKDRRADCRARHGLGDDSL